MLGTNTIAYYEKFKLTAVKSFIKLAPGVAVTTFFSLSLMLQRNKLECLFPGKHFNITQLDANKEVTYARQNPVKLYKFVIYECL